MLRHPPPLKKRPVPASLFVIRDATSRKVFTFNPLWPQVGTRGVASRFTIEPYEKENGESPVEDFINSLDMKMRAKVYGLLSILQDKGNMLREPYSKHLDDGIFELRCKVGSNITRVLYFFYYEGTIVLTNGFEKKTQKTPLGEIKLAKERRADYIERMEKL